MRIAAGAAALPIWVLPILSGCGQTDIPRESAEPAGGGAGEEAVLDVYVVNYPLAYFAERVGRNHVRVEFPVPSGIDPAYWSPPLETIGAYQDADLLILNGAGYASWVARASLPDSRLVDTSAGFADQYVTVEEAVVHTHGPEGEHEHQNTAFTTWLDPLLAIEQARAIRNAFAVAAPAHEAAFEAGFEALERDLLDLDARLAQWAEAWSGVPLLASHPVYQYLARRYALELRSVHFEPDQEPPAAGWRGLAELVQVHPARWMLWEEAPIASTVRRLASDLGIGSVVFHPCGNRPESGDYLSVMHANVESLEAMSRP